MAHQVSGIAAERNGQRGRRGQGLRLAVCISNTALSALLIYIQPFRVKFPAENHSCLELSGELKH